MKKFFTFKKLLALIGILSFLSVTAYYLPLISLMFATRSNMTLDGNFYSKHYILEKKGKRVSLLGMMHIADKEFFKYINKEINKENGVILYEMMNTDEVLSGDKDIYFYQDLERNQQEAIATIFFRDVFDFELQIKKDFHKRKNSIHSDLNNNDFKKLSFEEKISLGLALGYKISVSTPEILLLSIDDEEGNKLKQASKEYKEAYARELYLNKKIDHYKEIYSDADKDDWIIDRRNQKVLEVFSSLEENYDTFTIPWGDAHLDGIKELLEKKGYKLVADKNILLFNAVDLFHRYNRNFGETLDELIASVEALEKEQEVIDNILDEAFDNILDKEGIEPLQLNQWHDVDAQLDLKPISN